MDDQDRTETRAFRAALLFCLCRLARVIYSCADHNRAENHHVADNHICLMEESRDNYLTIAGKER